MRRIFQRTWETNRRSARSRRERKGEKAPIRFCPVGALNSICYPLSYQICGRYLRGLDLDYTPGLVQAVRNGAPGGIKYIFAAHAILGGEGEPSVESLELRLDNFSPVNLDRRPDHPNETGGA